MAHNALGGFKKNSLPFAHRQIEAADHTENELVRIELKLLTGLPGEGRTLGTKEGSIDARMDDVQFFGGENTRRTVMTLRHGGGRVVMAAKKNFGDKGGDGDDRIRLNEKMFLAEAGSGALGEVTGKDDQRTGFNEAGGKESGPVVVPVVGVEDAGFRSAQDSRQAKDLKRAKARQGVEGKVLRGVG